MTTVPAGGRPRPREVTFGGTQAIVGGALALVLLIGAAQQLYSSEMHDVLSQALENPRAAQLGITLETARTMAKYGIMIMAVLSVASLILGVYVLRRHGPSRIALTALGVLVAASTLFAGPSGWAITLYVVSSLAMLWSKPARAWFTDPPQSASGAGPAQWGGPSVPPPPPPPPRR